MSQYKSSFSLQVYMVMKVSMVHELNMVIQTETATVYVPVLLELIWFQSTLLSFQCFSLPFYIMVVLLTMVTKTKEFKAGDNSKKIINYYVNDIC